MADKPHWIKGEPERRLFVEDCFAMLGLPEAPFDCVAWEERTADKKVEVAVGGRHLYSTDPSLQEPGHRGPARDDGGGVVALRRAGLHPRARLREGPDRQHRPSSRLPLLAWNCGAWQNSRVRAALPDALREHMDSLGGGELRVMRDQAGASGWDAALQAVTLAIESTGRVDEVSVAVTAARPASGTVSYDEPVDLGAYDEFMGGCRG